MFHGPKVVRAKNWAAFEDAEETDAVVLTHAHIDHSGLLPKFVKEGFAGPIYSSEATYDLCRIMLIDSAYLQEEDARYANKSGHSRHKPALPLYTTEDAHRALKLFKPVKQDTWHKLSSDLSFRLTRSGHILGSSFVEFSSANGNGQSSVLFSGDLGSGRSSILRPPVQGLEADVLILESTYGDRIQPKEPVGGQLAGIVNRVFKRGGVVVIPAFAVGRTQEILFHMQQLKSSGLIPDVPVFVDSPMANQVTDLFLRHPEEHLPVSEGSNIQAPIDADCFEPIVDVEQSKALNAKSGPMVIISAAGMLNGGRVMHHLKTRLPDERNALLFVGYQAAETKGRLLQDGIKTIRIHHQEIPVRAEVVTIEGMSAHADQSELIDWVKRLRNPPKRVFINHGDDLGPEVLAAKLRDERLRVDVPYESEEFDL